jgi:cobalt-zinc-cadmium resistance protein CzcA
MEWVLGRGALAGVITVAWIIGGIFAWSRLPIDAFPDVTGVQVTILSTAPDLAAVDVEEQISYPIEQAMRGLPRVLAVRSVSRAGLSQVVIGFEDGAETYWTRQIVFERLAGVRDRLPAGVEPALGPISTGLGEIFQYTLESDTVSAMDLRTIQDWLVAPLLQPVSGVNEVNSFGGLVRQYQVLVRPDSLLEYGISLEDVVGAVERSNGNAGGGVVVRDWEQMVLRGVGLLGGIPDIEDVVIKADRGTFVRISDVAEVVIGGEPRQGAVTRDGKGEVVAGMVILLKGENSKDVIERTKAAVARVDPMLPEGVRLDVFYDRTSLIEACVKTVTDALLEGAVFVVLILFLFVAHLRTALIVLLSLPLTYMITFVVMWLSGLSANLMSLGGLAFSVGMVVDASIVVVENIRRHLASNPAPDARRGVVAGAFAEVARPVIFSALVVVVILLPLYTLQGIEGRMFGPLATALLIAILASLVLALTVIPVLAERVLKRIPDREFRFVSSIHRGYMKLLDRVLKHPRWTMGIATGFVIGAGALTPFIGTEFMPYLDEGSIAINVVRLPNASLDGAVRVSTFLEHRLLRFPEVQTVVGKSGRAQIAEDPMGPEQTDLLVMLKPRNKWGTGRTKGELVEAINRDLSEVPGLRFSFSQPIALRVNELVSGIKSDLAIKVFGDDLEVLKGVADRVAAILGGIDGARDVKVEQVTGMNQVDVRIDRAAIARHGIDVATVNRVIETGIGGRVATTLIEGQRRSPVVVRLEESARQGIPEIERLLVPGPGGTAVPLGDLATLEVVEAPAQVGRENGIRRVVVEANIRGRDLGGFVAEARLKLAGIEAELPQGAFLEYGGQFENQQRAMKQLAIVIPIALALILLFLYMALGSIGASLLVLLNLPFGLVGGVFALWAFGMTLSVSAAIAFIVLLGVAVQNGVVLTAFFGQLRLRGMGIADTVREGCSLRFRPLLMTALTSFIGHLPMLYATGPGADIQKPLAVVVMGGLVTSTLLTLLVLPVLYGWFAERGYRLAGR